MKGYALGIGDIELHSALNQYLDAEIPLVTSDEENPSDIQIQLAPPEAFEKAGIPWNYFLSNLKFKTIVKKNGDVIVKLSSKEAVREPFLNFLLEVSWPKGSLYREFTVLVDPPATYQKPTTLVTTPSAKKPALTNSQAKVKKSKTNRVGVVSDNQYGPVPRNDTLWEIAERVKSDDSIRTEQMVMALFKANPDAFFQNNINALMEGKTLTIPDQDFVLQTSKKQARAEFRGQVQAWRSRNSVQDSIVADAKQGNELKLVPPSEDDGSKSLSTGTASTDATNQYTTQESAEKISQMNRELDELRNLLTIKDKQIAELQAGKLSGSEAIVSEPKKLPALKDEVSNPKENAKTEIDKVLDESNKTDIDIPITVPTIEEAAKPAKKQVKVKEQAEEESSILPAVLGSAGFGLLGLFGWLWWRNNRVASNSNIDSILASSSEIHLPDVEEDNLKVSSFQEKTSVTPEEQPGGENSFLSDFSLSDFDTFGEDHGEVDPIAEADVYLAYGRYQQAEELMRQAINDYPERDECKLKLLEIYYANEDKEAFEKYANELNDSGKSVNADFWSKVVEMGSDLCPSATLFSASSSDAATNEGATEPVTKAAERVVSQEEERTLEFNTSETAASKNEIELDDLDGADLSEMTLKSDFEFNAETLDLEDAEEAQSMDSGLSVMTEEYETKLDLARAYIDMGDEDAAKSIIDEVMKQGEDSQKNEAKEILKKLK